ncbi:zinc finger CCCH domain-containing protein 23-like [Momordica charantia]|uniref:Zinc finger CCCH domain-containing protein 23-like n=1 Tax=Momordica charantia TaxID=3673 RepID=A0A6J1CEX8_MOMCH|nr:zinc finger CCCH domain-containing protein 23-like [Momordica charantia]
MMISERTRFNHTIEVPQWDPLEDHPLTGISSPVFVAGVDSNFIDSFAAIHRFLPSNDYAAVDSDEFDVAAAVDGFSCDHFRMFEFKIRRCARGRSHDWTECPYAHPGEKARRRDPRKYHYSGTACPEFRKGNCKKGDSCDLAHGIFECWLHPARYRTQPCKDGLACRRRVCFFAHSPEQLRVLPRTPVSADSVDGSSRIALAFDSYLAKASFVTSPTSILSTPPDSPPLSPNCPQIGGGSFNSMNGIVASMHKLQIGKSKSSPQWGVQMAQGLCSPSGGGCGFYSSPTTPTTGKYELWGKNYVEEPAMERVESGRDLRAKMYAKLSKDNSVEQLTPDVGWVSELLK